MTLNLVAVGEKVRRYREQLELSLEEVSLSTGISLEDLTAYESGFKEPRGDDVLILADLFKCDYKFLISNDQLAPFEQTEQLYRRFGNDFSKSDRRVIQEFLFLCESEEYLLHELGRDQQRLPFSFRKMGSYYKAHGEKAADSLRRHLGYSNNEVGINIYEDLRRIGVHVFRRKLGNSNISGLYVRHPTAGKCVLINYSEDVYRQRFTAAHEGGHTILDDDQDVVVSFVSLDDNKLVELRANTFASRYLIPPELLRNIAKSTEWNDANSIKWASKLKVSVEALANALSSAKLISQDTAGRMKRFRVPKESKIDPELPLELSSKSRERKEYLLSLGLSDFYVELCFDGYHQGCISQGRLSECLLIDQVDLPDIAKLYGRSLLYGD